MLNEEDADEKLRNSTSQIKETIEELLSEGSG